MRYPILAIILAATSILHSAPAVGHDHGDAQKAVLVTGASSGIGRHITERPWDRSVYKAPDEVAGAAYRFFTEDEPLRRYMVVPNEQEAGWTINQIIAEMVQLNEGQAFRYSRDELVAMLDAALNPETPAE